jgi:hypothetical protein
LPANGSATLVEPLDGVISGKRTFRWTTNVTLAENQYFEMVFWPAGQDPLTAGFGPGGSTQETAITVDLDGAANSLPNMLVSGQKYQWGVLLVQLNPYQRLQYLGGGHEFQFERTGDGGGGSSGGGGNPPAPTERPR